MKKYLFAAAAGFLLLMSCATTKPAAGPPTKIEDTPVDVVIDHASGLVTPSGLIRKRPGDVVHILVQHTNLDCFSFNATVKANREIGVQDVKELPLDQRTEFGVRYDGDPITITVAAYKRDGASNQCPKLPDRTPGGTPGPWTIDVANDGWELAFAGAFTADNLTDPAFSIAEKSAATATTPATYEIFKNKGDSVHLGSAAMVHLYHTEPDPLGRGGVNIVPFSFGLGVGDASNVRYYFGPGIRFDKKLFLNLGVVLGPQKTLNHRPDKDITTDANFLTGHTSTRTAAKFFFSVSYSFIGVGADAFKAPFKSIAPTPTNPGSGAGGGGGNDGAAVVEAVVTKAGADAGFTYKLEVSNKGGKAENLTVESAFPGGAKGTWKVKPTGHASCGSDQADAQTTFKAKIPSLPNEGGCEYDVKLDKPEAFTKASDVKPTVKDAAGNTIFPAAAQ